MALTLYFFNLSVPCRAVLLLAQIIGLQLDQRSVDITKGEQLQPDFVALNPQHTVPTLVDGDLRLWESRAIMTYLCDQYATAGNDSLYPRDSRIRAVVDQRLQFDLGTLYPRVLDTYYYTVMTGKAPDEEQWDRLRKALGFLDEMLRDRQWLAADTYTVADVGLTVTVGQLEAFGAELGEFGRVRDWLERSKAVLEGYKYEEIEGEAKKVVAGFYEAQRPK